MNWLPTQGINQSGIWTQSYHWGFPVSSKGPTQIWLWPGSPPLPGQPPPRHLPLGRHPAGWEHRPPRPYPCLHLAPAFSSKHPAEVRQVVRAHLENTVIRIIHPVHHILRGTGVHTSALGKPFKQLQMICKDKGYGSSPLRLHSWSLTYKIYLVIFQFYNGMKAISHRYAFRRITLEILLLN